MMVVLKDCSIDVMHLITLGILIDSAQIMLLGIGWSVAVHMAGIKVLLEDVGLLHMSQTISWSTIAGYVTGIRVLLEDGAGSFAASPAVGILELFF